MLRLDNVSKKLNSFVLKDISFELPAGYICGLIGENGAGKTTLLNILSGLYTYDEGTIQAWGKDYMICEDDIRQDIGFVFHGDIFDPYKSLAHNGAHYGRFYVNYNDDVLQKYMIQFKLDAHRKYRHLSKGEKLKFAFAFALSHSPRLLLLDEPSANLDSEFREEFHNILREFTYGGENSVILSTHITSDIEHYADYLLFLGKGSQILYGDIETVRGSYRMVSGEAYKIKLLKDRIVHMEEGKLGCKALVKHSHRHRVYDSTLTVWEPSILELMQFMV